MNTEKIKKSIPLLLFLFALTMVFTRCKHRPDWIELPTGPGGPIDTVIVNPDPCDPDSAYFSQILPLLVSNCATEQCHDAVNPEEGIQLYDYAHIMASDVIDPGNPNNSEIIEVITETDPDKRMPPPDAGDALLPEEIQLIETWISQGALNNTCIADCDPELFAFSANIKPVIEMACDGCHSGTNPDGGVSLMTYDQISAIALDGRLMNVLYGTNGYTLMPYNTAGLTQCNIDQFQNWVDAGAPND